MSQLEAAAEVLRLANLAMKAASDRWHAAIEEENAARTAAMQAEQAMHAARHRLLEVAALSDHQMAQSA